MYIYLDTFQYFTFSETKIINLSITGNIVKVILRNGTEVTY